METRRLETVLTECQAPSDIDYLSIDIEGSEERVLGSFDFGKYRFKCMTVERPTHTLMRILKENGYVLIKEIPRLDCFYIHESLSEQYHDNVISFHAKYRLTWRWR